MTDFWGNDVKILFERPYIYEVIPLPEMSYNEKINALSRGVILLSIIGFLWSFSITYLLMGVIALVCIYFYMLKERKEGFGGIKEKVKSDVKTRLGEKTTIYSNYNPENFDEPIDIPIDTFLKEEYYPTKENNPLGNILLTDYKDDPNRKPAPPSFNPIVIDDINDKSKEITKDIYPGLNTKPLYSGLGNNMEFDDLMMQFYSTPSTTIPNDQGSFADYLYGNMPSCKSGDAIQCVKDNFRYI